MRLTAFFTLYFLAATSGTPLSSSSKQWCTQPLQHGQIAHTTSGEIYVKDGRTLRRFSSNTLIKWYRIKKEDPCMLKTTDFQNYTLGAPIHFRPDNSLEASVLLQVPHQKTRYLWHAGKVHKVISPPPGRRFAYASAISQLELDSLPRGGDYSGKELMQGAVVLCEQTYYLYIQKKLRAIKKEWLKFLNSAPGPTRIISKTQLNAFSVGPAFTSLKSLIPADNTLIRGSHPQRIYLIKNGKRYYFWSQWAFQKRGYKAAAIVTKPDDELYLIPFGGNLY